MGAIAGLLLPFLPSVINMVEALFSSKPKQGVNKMDAVVEGLRAIVAKMITSGQVTPDGKPVVQPTDDNVKGMIELALQQMKVTGTLGNIDAGQLYLLRGSITALTAKAIG